MGPYKFVFQADAPDPRRIPTHDVLGVTVILLSCFYHEKVRAYHVHTMCMARARTVVPGPRVPTTAEGSGSRDRDEYY